MGESYDDHLRELLSGLGPVTLRRMFGGRGVYHDGLIIGLVMGEELFLKTDAQSVAAFESAGGQPFVYDGKGKSVRTSYWLLPAEAMESAQAMRPWAVLAWEAARRKSSESKPGKKKSAKPGAGKPRR
jgi:DNA transformation protein